MRIVLDTTEIRADPALSGVYFRLLREYLASSGSQLFIPEVVILEARRQVREEVTGLVAALLDAARKLKTRYQWDAIDRTLADELEIGDADDDMLEYTWYGDLQAAFERRLTALGASIMPTPDIVHPALVSAELSRRRPFDGTGRGYRDALIWCTVVEAARDGTETAFITRNSQDFPASPQGVPGDDLLAWLREADVPSDHVHVFHGLERFAQARVIPGLPRLWEKVALEAGKHDLLDIRQVAEDHLTGIHDAVEERLRNEYPDATAGLSFRWEDLDPPEVHVLDRREVSDGRGLVVARLNYRDAVADDFREASPAGERGSDRHIWVVPRGIFEVGMEQPKRVDFSVQIAVLFDTRTGAVEDVQLSQATVRTSPSEWVPWRRQL